MFGIVGIVLGKPITGLLATSDLFAAIIGLALQRMIADIFSGLALTVERPFTIGDWLEIGSGLAGKIIEANWVRRDPVVAPGARWRCRSVRVRESGRDFPTLRSAAPSLASPEFTAFRQAIGG